MVTIGYANRSAQSFTKRSPGLDSFVQDVVVQAKPCRQHGKRKSLSFPFNQSVVSAVVFLLAFAGPSTVARLIVAINVNSIKRSFERASTHVAKELFKAVPPLFAYLYSSTAVVMKRFVIFICASLNHRIPRFKLWGISHAVGSSAFARQFGSSAPARSAAAIFKAKSHNRFNCSARTQAFPASVFFSPLKITFNHCESAEYHAR